MNSNMIRMRYVIIFSLRIDPVADVLVATIVHRNADVISGGQGDTNQNKRAKSAGVRFFFFVSLWINENLFFLGNITCMDFVLR